MARNTVLYSIRLFLTSLGAGILLVLTICYYFDDFSSPKIFEYMFWVGALKFIVGGTMLSLNNPYKGASMAITTQLRHNSKGQESSGHVMEGFARGVLIATPGIIMMGVSFFWFSMMP